MKTIYHWYIHRADDDPLNTDIKEEKEQDDLRSRIERIEIWIANNTDNFSSYQRINNLEKQIKIDNLEGELNTTISRLALRLDVLIRRVSTIEAKLTDWWDNSESTY